MHNLVSHLFTTLLLFWLHCLACLLIDHSICDKAFCLLTWISLINFHLARSETMLANCTFPLSLVWYHKATSFEPLVHVFKKAGLMLGFCLLKNWSIIQKHHLHQSSCYSLCPTGRLSDYRGFQDTAPAPWTNNIQNGKSHELGHNLNFFFFFFFLTFAHLSHIRPGKLETKAGSWVVHLQLGHQLKGRGSDHCDEGDHYTHLTHREDTL